MLFNIQSKLLFYLLFRDINQKSYTSVAFLKSVSIYKLIKTDDTGNFSAQFIEILSHYKKDRFKHYSIAKNACLVFNPFMVGSFSFLFNGTPECQASECLIVPTQRPL